MKYIDPTGKLVIFINGLAPIFKTGGASKYWDGFDKAVMEHLNDNKAMYVNGAVTLNGFGDGVLNYVNNKNSISRYVAGYKYGKVNPF